MFTYPQLTSLEQAGLPKLTAQPSAITNKFEDSTHQLFYCQTADGEMVLKVCNQATIRRSSFWSGANRLFAADFPNSLGNIHFTHHFLEQSGGLTVPDFVAASANRYILTRFLNGKDLETENITDQWVIQLAEHIAKLHQCSYPGWGTLHAPQFSAADWASRLHDTLVFLAKQHDTMMAEPLLAEMSVHATNIQETGFVPVMLDLRWDQFRCLGTNNLALIDLDAFVIAPRALDLVLLEYVLTSAQLVVFKQRYTQTHSWPEHTKNTRCYQLLLFLMNVLGESDLANWMQRI
ncbi:MAG TPA: phosphotransferase [Methylophilus sp.]|uniref:phosphotransferase n=1 Tax=Methylophilus sp. TaxID=29541 RepID=UPI002CBAC9C1|nr:phosphotransferase [Methylophilus sp.]HSH86263.1 phosphotransferase [Methylophilus sp.]